MSEELWKVLEEKRMKYSELVIDRPYQGLRLQTSTYCKIYHNSLNPRDRETQSHKQEKYGLQIGRCTNMTLYLEPLKLQYVKFTKTNRHLIYTGITE